FHVCNKFLYVALLVSMFPLIRPEGFFFIVPFSLYFLLNRKWLYFLILLMPGFFYFLWLLTSLNDFFDYFRWRVEYREYTNYIHFPFLYGAWNFFVSYNILFFSFCVFGCFFVWRQLWPFIVGAFGVLAWFLFSVQFHASFYEPRYFVSIVPVMIFLFGIGTSKIFILLRSRYFRRGINFSAFSLILIFIILNHILQVDEIRMQYTTGKRLPFYTNTELYSAFRGYDTENVEAITKVLPYLYDISEHQGRLIKALFVPMQQDVFYFLDP